MPRLPTREPDNQGQYGANIKLYLPDFNNGTEFGLVAGIWTRDGGRQMRVAKKMRCGQVFVNGYGAGGGIELPFGGVKKSGHGREKGMEAMREFSHTKTIVFKHG